MIDGLGAAEEHFEGFFARHEPVVRRVLVAGLGAELGRDAAAEAFAWAWSTWPKAASLANPGGYLYRIGTNWASRWIRRGSRSVAPIPVEPSEHRVEPGLAEALGALSPRQREVIVLVEAHGYTHAEAAAFVGIARTSVQNHVERGMAKLRHELGVDDVG